jgi:hypothetical protein
MTLRRSRLQQAFIVHRLDRETSGLMVFARNQSIQAILQQNWKKIVNRYLAVVEGVPVNGQGTLRDHLVESNSFMVQRVDKGGALAITHYRVLRRDGDKSLLELTLETGRKNQVRVQLAALGHPIVGDRKYGATSDPVRRLALHSCEIKFRHPVSGASMEFQSGLPAQLEQLLDPAYHTREMSRATRLRPGCPIIASASTALGPAAFTEGSIRTTFRRPSSFSMSLIKNFDAVRSLACSLRAATRAPLAWFTEGFDRRRQRGEGIASRADRDISQRLEASSGGVGLLKRHRLQLILFDNKPNLNDESKTAARDGPKNEYAQSGPDNCPSRRTEME